MITISKLKPGTHLLIESIADTIYSLCVRENGLLDVYSTDAMFRNDPPKRAKFIGSCHDKAAPRVPDRITKGNRMVFEFFNAYFVSEPVLTALVEGDGWKYEAIT